RFGREQTETQFRLNQIINSAGIRVVCWGDAPEHGREIKMSTAMEKFTPGVSGFRDEAEIEKDSQRAKASALGRWERGEIVSRSPYGYDKAMKPIAAEVAVIRRIFEMKAMDSNPGYWVIARKLNDEKVPSPRAGKVYKKEQMALNIWGVSTVRGILMC